MRRLRSACNSSRRSFTSLAGNGRWASITCWPPEAKKQGVKLLFLQIPREVMEQQAVDKGDIEFFELAYLEVDIEKPKQLTARIKLKDFVIPNTELIPEEVRSTVKT